MLVKDAANGASASIENGTSTPPKSAPRARKHDSGTFTVCFSPDAHFAIAAAMSTSAPPIDSLTTDVGASTGTLSHFSATQALEHALRFFPVDTPANSH